MFGMEGVGLIGSIIIGLLAGWIAERVTGANHGLLLNLIVGLVGGLVGGILASLIGWADGPNGFWANLIMATIGAIVLLLVLRAIRGGGRPAIRR